ncbi:hypothetical protein RCS94_06255 [Orbaceae bacterium ac157xtp]
MTIKNILAHNKQIKQFLYELNNDVNNAKQTDELFDVVNKIIFYGKPIKFNNNINYICCLLFALIAIITYLAFKNQYFISILATILSIGSIAYIFLRGLSLASIEKKLIQNKIYFDNTIHPISYEKRSLTKQLLNDFKDFSRGNNTKEIDRYYAGVYQGKEYKLEYNHYRYHYVVRVEKTVTDSKGNTKTVVEYHHYYRYGIIIAFPFIRSVCFDKPVRLFGHSIYKPASNRFNKIYALNGTISEFDIAKFLKPIIVTAFEDIYEKFKELHFEFNNNNMLCMSYEDKDTLFVSKQISKLEQPEIFLSEFQRQKRARKLHEALNFIETLMIYSDNNFTNRS